MMRLVLALLAMTVLCACASTGGNTDTQLAGDLSSGPDYLQPMDRLSIADLPDFPLGTETPKRSISDDSVILQGREWFSKSEGAEEIGSTLELNEGNIAWGIYSLGGFGEVTPGSVYASFYTDDQMPCRIYLAVADFRLGRWRFMDAGKDDFLYEFPSGGTYHSENGNCYVAVLRHLEGDAKLYTLSFGRLGATDLEAPAGLEAVADPGIVQLDWLPVDGAVGYNVYRAYDRDFTDQIRLNEGLLQADNYVDTWLINGEMYYYRVTAVAAIESSYSLGVNVYVPAADLPAPQNLRATDVGDFHFEIEWDWEGSSPAGWAIFLAHSRDFNLDSPTERKDIPFGGTRKYRFDNLDPGRLYFVRMAARSSTGALGRMTEAIPCLTGEQWEWYDIEEIGDGTEPVCAVIADGQICASYLNEGVVTVARNNGVGQPWAVESTALDHDILFQTDSGDWVTAGGFKSFLDIDYRDGTYLICSVTNRSLDFYAAIGAPEVGWDVELIDQGTRNGLQSPAAGLYTTVAISDNGYNAGGVDFYSYDFNHYTRPFGDDQQWSKKSLTGVPSSFPIDVDYEVRDGRLFAGVFDYYKRDLFFWDEDADELTQVSDNPEGWAYGVLFSDLELIGGDWKLAGYEGSTERTTLYEDVGSEVWSSSIVGESEDTRCGKACRLEPFRDGLICVYQGGGIRDWYCSVLRGNAEWETQLMKIGEIDAYERADLKILNDKPVFVVADRITKKVYAIRGNIPLN